MDIYIWCITILGIFIVYFWCELIFSSRSNKKLDKILIEIAAIREIVDKISQRKEIVCYIAPGGHKFHSNSECNTLKNTCELDEFLIDCALVTPLRRTKALCQTCLSE
jgi:hypothetical protein